MASEENKVARFIDEFMLAQQWLPFKINSGRRGNIWFNEWRIPPDVESRMIQEMSSPEIIAWYQSPNPPYHSGIPDRVFFRKSPLVSEILGMLEEMEAENKSPSMNKKIVALEKKIFALASHSGQTLFVEVKTKVGNARYMQTVFARCVRLMGFDCIIPKGEQDFLRQYHELIGDNEA